MCSVRPERASAIGPMPAAVKLNAITVTAATTSMAQNKRNRNAATSIVGAIRNRIGSFGWLKTSAANAGTVNTIAARSNPPTTGIRRSVGLTASSVGTTITSPSKSEPYQLANVASGADPLDQTSHAVAAPAESIGAVVAATRKQPSAAPEK